MSLAADEIALLVYRYLHESGFDHSAFTFGHESLLAHTDAVDCDLPYGSLIGLLQKGLQYLEIEKHVQADGSEAPHDASTTMMFDALRDSGGESSAAGRAVACGRDG
jgi:transducin (beta)-like 1